MSKTARKSNGQAGEAHRLSVAGRRVSAVAPLALGVHDASPTTAVKRRRTRNVWLSPREFARQFGVGVSAVYGAVERGELPAVRMGRHIRFPPESIERVIRNTSDTH